jgi:hypothetical protein
MARRGQAAQEFVTTYGWGALLVVLAIAIMAYFSSVNPEALVPDTCGFPVMVGCDVVGATTDGELTLRLQNLEDDAFLLDASCTYANGVKVTTRNVLADGEKLSQAWPKRGFKELTCVFDGDNPLAGMAGEVRRLSTEVTIQRPEGEYTINGHVQVLVEE